MKKRWLICFVIPLIIAAFVSPFASSKPDGLEKVAEDKGFLDKGVSHISSPIPDYIFPGINDDRRATGVAGVLGTIFVFVFMYGMGKIVVLSRKG